MSYAYVDPRMGTSLPAGGLRAGGQERLHFPAILDLCREQLPAAVDRDVTRLAAESRKCGSPLAFRPAFSASDWRVFASFCAARRLPADFRVAAPGASDRALRFVVEGCLWHEPAAPGRGAGMPAHVVPPGAMVGEDALFVDKPAAPDVRALEDCLVLELSWQRRNELAAAYPVIAFELMRAAGAVMVARLGRPS
jgi:hypothetical protein